VGGESARVEDKATPVLAGGLIVNYVGFSGGKDSTALAYKLREYTANFSLLFTPTGNELPEVITHVEKTARALDVPLIIPPGPSLLQLINEFNALPNHRQRWCTRMIKIVPCIAYLKSHPGSTLFVGLRADEEERKGLYSELVKTVFFLRKLGWGLSDVLGYLNYIGVRVPERTDCALCYEQRIIDWRNLLRKHPDMYAQGEALEEKTGHTFRSPTRDTWPASLKDLRLDFERGRKIRGEDKLRGEVCRVCRL